MFSFIAKGKTTSKFIRNSVNDEVKWIFIKIVQANILILLQQLYMQK